MDMRSMTAFMLNLRAPRITLNSKARVNATRDRCSYPVRSKASPLLGHFDYKISGKNSWF